MNLPATAMVICDTAVKHSLVSSAYNQRREECEQAVELLREKKPEVRSLRDLTIGDLAMIEELPQPERSRARHVISENDRTVLASRALEVGDVGKLGHLMTQSHASLRDDYQVSCRELDLMCELAQSRNGVSGIRMMGGGFGGCTISLVDLEHLEDFKIHMTTSYCHATGLVPAIHEVEADGGVTEMLS
jgi:galactokinase